MNELNCLDKIGNLASLVGKLALATQASLSTIVVSDIVLEAGKVEDWALREIKERSSTLPPNIEVAIGRIAQDLSSMLPDPLDWSIEQTRKKVRAVLVEVFDAYTKRIAELEAELAEIKDV